jgi:hypothetical protein
METDVVVARLAAPADREVVMIGREMPEAIQIRRRPVRDDSIAGISLPGRHRRCELEPCDSQVQVVRFGGARELVDAVADSAEDAVPRGEAIERGWGDTEVMSLPPRDQTPLLLRDRRDTIAVSVA